MCISTYIIIHSRLDVNKTYFLFPEYQLSAATDIHRVLTISQGMLIARLIKMPYHLTFKKAIGFMFIIINPILYPLPLNKGKGKFVLREASPLFDSPFVSLSFKGKASH